MQDHYNQYARWFRCEPRNMENKHVNKTLKTAFVALALAGATVMGVTVAGVKIAHAADVGVSFNLGDVAIGYTDGYWDHDHHWHKWQNTQHRRAYQHADGAEYHATAHTRAPNKGWHDHDDNH
jgi:hypothetical protein